VKIIIGLGNPGSEYTKTRHNIGFSVIDALARQAGINFRKGKCRCEEAKGTLWGTPVLLAKPQTFMNLSGEAVRRLDGWYGLDPGDWIVVFDDVSIPLERMRIRSKGGAGGHNGMRSILDHMGTKDFCRLRLGVGGPGRKTLTNHVLGRFSAGDIIQVDQVIDRAIRALELWALQGVEAAMNRYNVNESMEKDKGE
jgi:PTH1 family peptidyl-tRNA hydrolase